jgi:hypothetical protein
MHPFCLTLPLFPNLNVAYLLGITPTDRYVFAFPLAARLSDLPGKDERRLMTARAQGCAWSRCPCPQNDTIQEISTSVSVMESFDTFHRSPSSWSSSSVSLCLHLPAPSGWLTVSGCQTVGKADPVARLVCHLSVSTARTYPRTPGLGRAFSLRMTCFDRVDSLEQRRLRTSPRAHAAPFCKVSRLARLLPSDCTPPSKAGKTTLEHEFQARPFTAANSFRHTCVPRVCSSRGGVGG